jgi:hypothetical protein
MEHPAAAADVLVEARRNLQALIDSGISRQLLHQLVEESDAKNIDDASLTAFLYGGRQPQPYHQHRPRVSISSTSSGSSGHASLWSISTTSSAPSTATSPSSAWPPRSSTTAAPATATSPLDQTSLPVPMLHHSKSTSGLSTSSSKSANLYCCTSCDTTFKRKYDWKRHEDEFHERWKKYPCPEPGCNRSFWGANTFNQHHKQSHGCKTCPHSEKVVKYLRKRKYWACGFCSALHPSRERHVEHVARDFESGKTKAEWMHSRVIYGLLHQPLIHDAWKALLLSKQGEYAGRTPNFSWDPIKTGRAQGFLEGEGPGQLQDHLEFFSGNEAEAQVVVQAAYTLADIMFVNTPTYPTSPQQQQQQPGQSPYQMPQASGSATSFGSSVTSPTIASQASQQSLFSHDAMSHDGSQASFSQGFRHPSMIATQQMFQSPMTKSYPMPLRRASLDRDLPPPPPAELDATAAQASQQQQPQSHTPYPYLPNPVPVVMDDWQSFASTVVDEATGAAQGAGSTDWPMVDYFDASRGA